MKKSAFYSGALEDIRKGKKKLEDGLAKLQDEEDECLRETLVQCQGNCHGKGCGCWLPVREITYIQTHWYTPPRGCTEGDYWSMGEGNWICPSCGHRNRTYDRKEIEELKQYFKDVVNEHTRT